uniref:Uncharacterized protein n=1 Tax=Oryza barthii TaxID=65489 RepID=A0A0D3FFM2_9ORYZ
MDCGDGRASPRRRRRRTACCGASRRSATISYTAATRLRKGSWTTSVATSTSTACTMMAERHKTISPSPTPATRHGHAAHNHARPCTGQQRWRGGRRWPATLACGLRRSSWGVGASRGWELRSSLRTWGFERMGVKEQLGSCHE